eukprot:TRINITY_DN4669_c0_g1_i1.p1 TRINITY_DN4669_c0_g1~~TRINITY_DN4669_c0_g1_i1.p1  ORF type:complete len:338 (+),score=46.48 TRINITY_DN4669_c0_g1_i1:347-1360(+)
MCRGRGVAHNASNNNVDCWWMLVRLARLLLLLLLVATCNSQWYFSGAHVTHVKRRSVPPAPLYHLHVPKAAGTTISRLFPTLEGFEECTEFSNRLYNNPDAFERAAKGQIRSGACNFVSVEGDYEHVHFLPNNTVVFAMLREPLALLVSMWRHDMAKGKFKDVEEKYAAVESGKVTVDDGRQPMIGYGNNLQVLRIGGGHLQRAKERLHQIEFGVVEHFHASICLLLWATQSPLFASGCAQCDQSPLSAAGAQNQASGDTHGDNVSLTRLMRAYDANRADQRLYRYAYELFMARVRFVERETGRQLVCSDASDDQTRWFRGNITSAHGPRRKGHFWH